MEVQNHRFKRKPDSRCSARAAGREGSPRCPRRRNPNGRHERSGVRPAACGVRLGGRDLQIRTSRLRFTAGPRPSPNSRRPTARPIMLSSSRPASASSKPRSSASARRTCSSRPNGTPGASGSPFDFGGFRVPFLYSTNGEVIWFHDVRHPLNRSRRIADFHTPAALQEMLGRDFDAACQKLLATANQYPLAAAVHQGGQRRHRAGHRRPQAANARRDGHRHREDLHDGEPGLPADEVRRRPAHSLPGGPPGAGRPGRQRLRVFRARAGPEVRQDLRGLQPAIPPRRLGRGREVRPQGDAGGYLLDPKPGHAFVYVCTIQRMAINLFGRQAPLRPATNWTTTKPSQLDIPIHAFDLIVADECHRGYTSAELSIWRNTLEHFDAIKVGLTATPAAHTKAYFNDVVFRYEYERAVREGFLVDFDAVSHQVERPHGRRFPQGRRAGRPDRPGDRRASSSTGWKTNASSTPPKSSARSRRPTPTARSSKKSRSTPWSTSSATADFPRR